MNLAEASRSPRNDVDWLVHLGTSGCQISSSLSCALMALRMTGHQPTKQSLTKSWHIRLDYL